MNQMERNIIKEAEDSVIGSMLQDNATIPICMEILGDDGQAIMAAQNQLIYVAAVTLYSEGKPCDAVTIAEKMEASGELNRVGGIEYLMDIVYKTPTAENVSYYAKLVLDAFTKRKLIACGPKLKFIAESDISIDEMRGKVQEVVLRATGDIAKESQTIKEQANQAHQRLKAMSEGQYIQPIIALSQMSRASIRQQNPRPMLNDLRSSGALEFGADVVAFLYRDDYYEPTTPSPISETELIIRKNRDGPVGTLRYNYHRATSKFEEA